MSQQIGEQIDNLQQKLLQCINQSKQLGQRLLQTNYPTALAIKWNHIQSYLSKPFVINLPQQIQQNQQEVSFHNNNIASDESFTLTEKVQLRLDLGDVRDKELYIKNKEEVYNQWILESQISHLINEEQLLPINTNKQVNQQGKKKIKPRQDANNQDFQPVVPQIRQQQHVPQLDQNEEIDEDLCNDHGKRYFYQYQNQKQKKKKELCNMCLNNLQHKYKIICKRHNNIIKLKMKQQNIKQHLQIFLCQQCQQNPNYQSYELICDRHFHPINLICFDQKCIQNDRFLICKQCQEDHSHQLIKFDLASLKQKLQSKKYLDIKNYQKFLVAANQKIRMSSFSKMLKKIKNYTGLLQAISIYDEETLKLWVKQLMGSRQKQTMKILCFLQKITLKQQFSRFQRHLLLQVFCDRITQIQQKLYKQIQQKIEQYNSQIEKQLNIDYDQIQTHLNEKYKDIQLNEVESINKPCERLQQILEHHYHRIQSIKIKMYNQQIERDSQSLKLRSERRNLYYLFNTQYTSYEAKKIIAKLFYTPDKIQLKTGKDQDGQESQDVQNNQDVLVNQQENKKIRKYIESYCKYSAQQQEKDNRVSREYHYIFNHKFTTLQTVKIIYEHQSHLIDSKSLISLDSILALINSNKNLREIELDGFQICGFQMFVKSYYQKRVDLPKNFKISLCADIQFIVSNKETFNSQVDAFIFFINSMQYVSNIKTRFNLRHFQQKSTKLEQLLKAIGKIDKKRISLYEYHLYEQDQDEKFQSFLQILAQLVRIEQLELQYIIFEKAIETGQIIQNFTKIVEEAIHLQIRQCRLNIKPKLKKTETLTFIQVEDTFYDSKYAFLEHIQNPYLVKQLKIDYKQQRKQINLKPFNKLEYLVISFYFYRQRVEIYQINMYRISKRYVNPQNILIFVIIVIFLESSQSIYTNGLLFGQLDQIIKLRLCNIKVTQNNISSIPSKKIQELSLEKCKCITNSMMQIIDNKFTHLKRLAIKQEYEQQKGNQNNENGQKAQERQPLFLQCSYKQLLNLKISKQLLTAKEDLFVVSLRNQGTTVVINK